MPTGGIDLSVTNGKNEGEWEIVISGSHRHVHRSVRHISGSDHDSDIASQVQAGSPVILLTRSQSSLEPALYTMSSEWIQRV